MAKQINAWVSLENARVVIIKMISYVSKSEQLKLKTALKHIRKVEMILEKFVN